MSDLDFGAVVLGGNVFGWTVTRDEAFRIFDAFVERGGRSIDTADLYPAWAPGCQGGESEQMIGEWLAARGGRERVVLATKVAKWEPQRGLSPRNIASAVEASLRRLRTDYIDVYYAHEDDEHVPQPEYLAAFDALVKAGKVRVLGASNFSPERLDAALQHCAAHGLARFEVSQDHYNLIARGLEHTLFPVLARHGVKELPYWPLASGFLTGKYRDGVAVESARAGVATFLGDPNKRAALSLLDEIAAAHRVSVAAVALAWLRAHPLVAAPIASVRTVEQLGPIFEAATLTLADDERQRLSALPS